MAHTRGNRRVGTGNGKPRSGPNQGQPRGGNFVGNLMKKQETPWSESVRLPNQTVKPKHPDERNRTII